MKFYNSKNGLILIFFFFSISILLLGKLCPCDNKVRFYCKRTEFYGGLYSHLLFFIFLGYYFPDYFYTLFLAGILWEIFEYFIDDNLILKKNFGCLSKSQKNIIKKKYYYNVYRNDQQKYNNFFDKLFKLKKSEIHMWHASLADIIMNVVGFGIGYFIKF